MKQIIYAAAISLMLASCGGNGGKKFNPSERMAQADSVVADTTDTSIQDILNDSTSVKLSVLPPAISETVTQDDADAIALKLMQLVTSQGIGCLNTTPSFAIGARVASSDVKATGTAPQKYLANISIIYEILNAVTGDVYATATQTLSGTGNSSQQAVSAAFKGITITPEIQKMLVDGKSKILHWFEQNLSTFKGQVESACSQGNYPLALALIESVPVDAKEAYRYANSVRPQVLNQFKSQIADKELTAIMAAITEANGDYSADVYAHMMMLPEGSTQFVKGQNALTEYEKQVKESRQAKVTADQAASERQHQMQLAELNADLVKAQYQAEASSQAIRLSLIDRQYMNKGFWSSLGYSILGLFNRKSGDPYAGPSLNEILKK